MMAATREGHIGYAAGASLAVEADYCSVCGKGLINEDYALYEEDVGMCVADGIGSAPMGDAAARYACHVAMDALRTGSTACEAVEAAGAQLARFVSAAGSLGSGASLAVAKVAGNLLDVAWSGNVAFFALLFDASGYSLLSSLACGHPNSYVPLCGRSAKAVTPGRLSLPLESVGAFAMCTNGAWRSAGEETIGRILLSDASPREAAARLVFGCQSEDDSTALIARVQSLACRGKVA